MGEGEYLAGPLREDWSVRRAAELGLGENASGPGECRNCRHVALTGWV